jgi:hypothetical protein
MPKPISAKPNQAAMSPRTGPGALAHEMLPSASPLQSLPLQLPLALPLTLILSTLSNASMHS